MATVGDLIQRSLRLIKVLGSNETLEAPEAADAKEVFTDMVDAWSTEDLLIPIVEELSLQLVADEAEYTIGIISGVVPNTHFQEARPIEILGQFLRDGSGTDYPLKAVSVREYNTLSRKSDSARPSRVYFEKGWPSTKIRFMTVPYANDTLHLSVRQPLSAILTTAELTDEIDLPPGYRQTLVYNLAILLAPEYGKAIDPSIGTIAANGKRRLKAANVQVSTLGLDRALGNRLGPTGTYQITQGPQ